MKVLRYLIFAVVGIVVLLILAGIAVSMLVDPNDYREEIAAAVEQETGRDFELAGDLDLRVFPCCSLRLGELSLGNPPGWQDREFLRVQSAAVSLRLLPLLLRQELQVGDISLDGLQLKLTTRKDGSVNWEFDSDDGSEAAEDAGTDETGTNDLAIAGIRISDATVHYRDEVAGDDIRLAGINLATSTIRAGEPIDIDAAVAAEGLVEGQSLSLQLNTQALFDPQAQQLGFTNVRAQLDDTTITGAFRVTDFETLALVFDLQVDRLDADAYMGDASDAGDAGNDASEDARIEIPVGALRDLRLDGTLAINELVFEGAQLSDVRVTAAANDGLIRLHPLTASLYGGSYSGDARLDVRGRKPKLSVDEKLVGVALTQLLTDTAEVNNLSGIGNVSIKATASGETVSELLEQLSGAASFDLREGIYQGVDLWYEIRKARARLKKAEAPAAPADPRTELSEFAGTLNFSGGALQNPDLVARLPFMRLTGSGSLNLLDSTLNYTLRARVVDTPTFGDGEELDKLKGLAVPIKLSGALDSPSVSVDLGELAKSAAEQKIEEREQEVKDRVKDKVSEKLRGLFD